MWQWFVRWFSPASRAQRAWHMGVTALGLIVILVLLGNGLYGLFTHLAQSSALNAKASLDSTLAQATTQLSAPPSLLDPIRSQEQQAVTQSARDPSLAGWQHATQAYTRLQAQAQTVLATTPSQARTLAQQNLTQFQSALSGLVAGKYAEAVGYQGRYQQAQSAFQGAASTKDFFLVAGFAQDQTAAIAAYEPTYKHLQELVTLVAAEQKLLVQITGSPHPAQLYCADGVGNTPASFWTRYRGLMTHPTALPGSQPVAQQWLTKNQALFHAASSVKDYEQLNEILNGQIAQVHASSTALIPSAAASYLAKFKADIQTLQSYQSNIPAIKKTFADYHSGNPSLRDFTKDIATFQQQYDADAKLLSDAPFNSYSQALTQIQKHRGNIQFQVVYARTYTDIMTLGGLVAQGQSHTTRNPADGKNYHDAYEYADMKTGIGDIINPSASNPGRLYGARTLADYQHVDREVRMFIHNIQAMLTNLNDKTPYNQIHQTDTDLMGYYGIMQGKVMVVSLREQAARFYEDGKLVKGIYVTTGAPVLPSVPGINCASGAVTDQLMVSPDPPGSPDYYEPTPVKFGIYYHNYGYEIHDAWWRNEFGPYTNLPHHDPAAFNGGSHGCINISKDNMPWVFGWINYTNVPVVVY